MRYKKLYILPLLVLAALFGFTACSSEDDITDGGQTELNGDDIIVNAGIGANSVFTRSNPIGTVEEQKQFNEGDIILICDEAGKYSVYKLDAQGAWNFYNPTVTGSSETYYSCNPMKWDADQKTFCAAYPVGDSRWDGTERLNWYREENGYYSMQIFDQSTLANLALADVMYAKTAISEKPKDNTISFNFERQTARVIVKLKYNNQFDGLNPTVGNLQIYGKYSLSDEGSSSLWEPITPYYNSANDEYVVLLFPMTADASKQFMGLTINHDADANGKTSTDLTLTGTPTLEKGKSYTFNVLVGKEKLAIESVTVSDWQNEKVIDGGSLEVNPLASATTEDVGKVVTTEGNMFATAAEAIAAGQTPIAMIAYVGSNTGSAYNHGIAIAIDNAASADTTQYGEEKSLDNVQATLSAFAAKNKTPNMTGSWKIPSVKELERIFYQMALDDLEGADEDYINQVKEEWETIFDNGVPTSEDNFSVNCGSFVNKMTNCGGKAFRQEEFQSASGQNEAVAWGGILTSDYCDNGKPYLYVTTVEAFKTFQRVIRGEDDNETQSFVIRPIFAF